MLKKLLNLPERITYERLREACARHKAEVYAKVRVADVLPIDRSGVSQELYEFALQAHYDFVVTGVEQDPLFAVEFDGSQHAEPLQAERDSKKDELSRRFSLPVLWVKAEDLQPTESQLDRLTEVVKQRLEDHAERAAATARSGTHPPCPQCGAPMVEKPSRFDRFLGCSRYPDCKGTRELPIPKKQMKGVGGRTLAIVGSLCVVVVLAALALFFGRQFLWQQHATPQARPAVAGPLSSMSLHERQAYANDLSDSNYPACPVCGNSMVLRRNSKTGEPFFGCSEFPECRGTRDVQYPK